LPGRPAAAPGRRDQRRLESLTISTGEPKDIGPSTARGTNPASLGAPIPGCSTPEALAVLAEARGFRVVEVDYDELRGMKPDDLRLF
jgi:hypothetical protein